MNSTPASTASPVRHLRAGDRFLRLSAIVALAIWGCRQAAGKPQPLPERACIQISITPGKPGAPTETVTATWQKDKGTLTVSRAPDGEKATPVTVTMAADEFQPLWDIVHTKSLFNFRPEPRPGMVFDFGEIKLLADSRPANSKSTANDGKTYNSVSWQTALDNQASIQPLISALAKLASAECPEPKLVYFR